MQCHACRSRRAAKRDARAAKRDARAAKRDDRAAKRDSGVPLLRRTPCSCDPHGQLPTQVRVERPTMVIRAINFPPKCAWNALLR